MLIRLRFTKRKIYAMAMGDEGFPYVWLEIFFVIFAKRWEFHLLTYVNIWKRFDRNLIQ